MEESDPLGDAKGRVCRSQRVVNRPNWHYNYDMDASAFVLSAESLVEGYLWISTN